MKLHVTPEEFCSLKEWSILPEHEFLGKVYSRYPWLRDKSFGEVVEVIVDWPRPKPCPCMIGSDGYIYRQHTPDCQRQS